MWIATATSRVFSGIGGTFSSIGDNIFVFSWDFLLFTLNVFSLRRRVGSVVRKGSVGFAGQWPEYVAPGPDDSRSCCPFLNAMANHGILPHDGKNIKFTDLSILVRQTYNFAPSFTYFASKHIATILNRDYKTGTVDLADISVHNGIEHDASLCRKDTYFDHDQSKPDIDLCNRILSGATGPNNTLTTSDISLMLEERRRESRRDNPQYSQSFSHKLFGSSNASGFIRICGGKIDDLTSILLDERIPAGWESSERCPWGLTFASFNVTVFKVELGIDENRKNNTTQIE